MLNSVIILDPNVLKLFLFQGWSSVIRFRKYMQCKNIKTLGLAALENEVAHADVY